MGEIMDTTSETNVHGWVDAQLASLKQDSEWQPDICKALGRLRDQQLFRKGHSRRLTWIAAGAVAACIGFMALPVSGVLAHRCLECSVAILQSLAASRPAAAEVKPVAARKLAPDFTLSDASAKAVKLSDYKGKVVLLNFWATWCGGCKVEMPELIDFQRKYKDRGLTVIGVSTDDKGWKVVKPFIDEKKINYTVVLRDDETCKRYGVAAMPVTFLIDREGRIAATHEGVVNKTVGESEIEMLLQESTSNTAK